MPLPPKTRYRYRELKSGKKQRLAFLDNKVIEVKGYKRRKGRVRGHTKRIR